MTEHIYITYDETYIDTYHNKITHFTQAARNPKEVHRKKTKKWGFGVGGEGSTGQSHLLTEIDTV
jgi:hypothetical protein